MALMVLACRAGLSVHAVHLDHGLRPGSADEAAVVETAARRFGATFEARALDIVDGPNLEARARDARHESLGPDALFGHTADDRVETLLLNLARGAGPEGLAAIRGDRRHPILGLRRHETHRVCAEFGIVTVADPTNTDPRFARNRIRLELLPLLADISGRDPVPVLDRTATHLRELTDAVGDLAGSIDPRDVAQLRAAPRVLAVRSLRDWLRDAAGHPPSTAELDRVWDVVEGRVRACELAGGRRIGRRAGRLSLTPGNGGGIGSVR